MPYQEKWIDPDIALEHHGVTVYCTYRDDDYDQGASTYYFTLDPEESGDYREDFDIRELDTPAASRLMHSKHNGRPFIFLSGEPFESMDEIGKAYAKSVLNAYHDKEPAIIRQALREAIEGGLLDEFLPD